MNDQVINGKETDKATTFNFWYISLTILNNSKVFLSASEVLNYITHLQNSPLKISFVKFVQKVNGNVTS